MSRYWLPTSTCIERRLLKRSLDQVARQSSPLRFTFQSLQLIVVEVVGRLDKEQPSGTGKLDKE